MRAVEKLQLRPIVLPTDPLRQLDRAVDQVVDISCESCLVHRFRRVVTFAQLLPCNWCEPLLEVTQCVFRSTKCCAQCIDAPLDFALLAGFRHTCHFICILH
jgi:hypothetical protein